MRFLLALMWVMGSVLAVPSAAQDACPAALDFHKRPLTGKEPVHLCELFRGKVVLMVNTASKCAFTPQYEGLEALYARYRERGLVVAGFPSNDFGGQEPGSEKQIKDFCRLTYSVQFPMFEKTPVRGAQADPLYRYLFDATGDAPQWNFHKYLIGRDGRVVSSFASSTSPEDPRLIEAIEALL